jgi:hypothetical protein
MNDATLTALVAASSAVTSSLATSWFRRPKDRADAIETLTQAAVSVVEQLRTDNQQLRDDLDHLKRVVTEQQAEVERCEERYRKLEAVLRLRWDLDADIDIPDLGTD